MSWKIEIKIHNKMKSKVEFIKERYPFYDEDVIMDDIQLNGEQVQELMQQYAEQESVAFAEWVKDHGFEKAITINGKNISWYDTRREPFTSSELYAQFRKEVSNG